MLTIIESIIEALSDDLRRAPWRGNSNPLAGHCYVASEAAWHLFAREQGFSPAFVRHEGSPHWYLRKSDGTILDITAGQFDSPPDYSRGKGIGFLTKKPSKRAQVVIDRIGAKNVC